MEPAPNCLRTSSIGCFTFSLNSATSIPGSCDSCAIFSSRVIWRNKFVALVADLDFRERVGPAARRASGRRLSCYLIGATEKNYQCDRKVNPTTPCKIRFQVLASSASYPVLQQERLGVYATVRRFQTRQEPLTEQCAGESLSCTASGAFVLPKRQSAPSSAVLFPAKSLPKNHLGAHKIPRRPIISAHGSTD